jgi:hypothetical protein
VGVIPATLLEREEKPSEKNEPTGGSRSSEGERDERDTGSGGALLGHGLVSCLGRNGALWPISIFIFFSSFSVFLFLP